MNWLVVGCRCRAQLPGRSRDRQTRPLIPRRRDRLHRLHNRGPRNPQPLRNPSLRHPLRRQPPDQRPIFQSDHTPIVECSLFKRYRPVFKRRRHRSVPHRAPMPFRCLQAPKNGQTATTDSNAGALPTRESEWRPCFVLSRLHQSIDEIECSVIITVPHNAERAPLRNTWRSISRQDSRHHAAYLVCAGASAKLTIARTTAGSASTRVWPRPLV